MIPSDFKFRSRWKKLIEWRGFKLTTRKFWKEPISYFTSTTIWVSDVTKKKKPTAGFSVF
jgi:hypothetical protein